MLSYTDAPKVERSLAYQHEVWGEVGRTSTKWYEVHQHEVLYEVGRSRTKWYKVVRSGTKSYEVGRSGRDFLGSSDT